jgi:hypothetical protein
MDLVLRTIYVFVLIIIVTRAVGRRELSSLEPFDLILLVVIGDLVQQRVTQKRQLADRRDARHRHDGVADRRERVPELPLPAAAFRGARGERQDQLPGALR